MDNLRKKKPKGQFRWANTYETGVSAKEKSEDGEEKTIKEIIEENFPELKKDKSCRFESTQHTDQRMIRSTLMEIQSIDNKKRP